MTHFWKSKSFSPGKLFLVSMLAFVVTVMVAIHLPAAAQISLPSLSQTAGSQALPLGVERQGALETAPIRLDGKDLFRIASPAVFDRSQPSNLPVEVRAKQIEANLNRLITDIQEDNLPSAPESLIVSIQDVNGYPVLFGQDDNVTEPKVLLTVTDSDAQYYSLTKTKLAEDWQGILQEEIRKALAFRQPEALKRQFSIVTKILIATLLLTLGLGVTWSLLGRREKTLEQRQAAESVLIHAQKDTFSDPPEVELRQRILEGLYQHLGLRRRLQIVRFLRWLLFWGLSFIWAISLAYSLNSFPQTRQFSRSIVIVPLVLLIAWFVIGLLNRIIDLMVDRFIQNLAEDQSLTPANLQRITTIARVIKGLKMVLVYLIGILWVLQWMGLIPGSILALGTAIALIVSLASQNLVKDLVNGFFILLEDQFRIGDFIRLGTNAGLQGTSGLVENLNLRITQIRSTEGNLITFSNGSIAQVENMSRTWARADFYIEVAYHTDVNWALETVKSTVEQMAKDPIWKSLILDAHELLGVEQLSHSGIMIRLWIKTAPLQQWNVARELRRRLKIAFDKANIRIGIPQQMWLQDGYSKIEGYRDNESSWQE
jgi:small-conductance mechanosensitive channel